MKPIHVCIEGEACVDVATLQEAFDLLGIDRPEEIVFEEMNQYFSCAEFHGIGRIVVDK